MSVQRVKAVNISFLEKNKSSPQNLDHCLNKQGNVMV